jgi:hypothetical protein
MIIFSYYFVNVPVFHIKGAKKGGCKFELFLCFTTSTIFYWVVEGCLNNFVFSLDLSFSKLPLVLQWISFMFFSSEINFECFLHAILMLSIYEFMQNAHL